MIQREAEVLRTQAPPNQAKEFRNVSLWIAETEDEIELTLTLDEFKKHDIKEGDKLSLKIDKGYDLDSMAQELFKQGK